jgi:hypothetical protein
VTAGASDIRLSGLAGAAGSRYNRHAMIVRRLWGFLLVASLLTLLATIGVAATADWTVSCGAGGSGLDCLPFNQHVSITTTTAPARWLGSGTLFAVGGIAFLALMASVIVWPATRPRRRKGGRAFAGPGGSRAPSDAQPAQPPRVTSSARAASSTTPSPNDFR